MVPASPLVTDIDDTDFCNDNDWKKLTTSQGDYPDNSYSSFGSACGGLELQRKADGVPSIDRYESQGED